MQSSKRHFPKEFIKNISSEIDEKCMLHLRKNPPKKKQNPAHLFWHIEASCLETGIKFQSPKSIPTFILCKGSLR